MSRVRALNARTRVTALAKSRTEFIITPEHDGHQPREPLHYPATPPEGWPHDAKAWRDNCLLEACRLVEAQAAEAAADAIEELEIPAEFATDKTRSK